MMKRRKSGNIQRPIHPISLQRLCNMIVNLGYEHVMIDTPSVDREVDEGKLACHHIFWDYPDNPQTHRSITELIYVPDSVKDGLYT
jgi:hypothetical protein